MNSGLLSVLLRDMEKKIKAAFFDIDGTLVSFNTHAVPESAREALKTLRENGILVFIATGRPFVQINNLDGLEFDGWITLNGALCLDAARNPVAKNPIPDEDVRALIRYIAENPCPVVYVSQDAVTLTHIDDRVRELLAMVNVPPPTLMSLEEAVGREALQISLYVDEAKEKEVLREALRNCDGSRWNPMFADFNAKGSTKASGIDLMGAYFGFDASEAIAFGDGGNDIPMLRRAGIGVAMGNARDEVKREADYVTASVDEDGVWQALHHFGLI